MSAHPWLPPSAALVSKVARARVTAVLRGLTPVPSNRLGSRAAAWQALLAALPALLRTDTGRVVDAVGRVDVLSALADLADDRIDAGRIERALVTLWLGIAGHAGLASPLALPGPFCERVVDPHAPRLLALGDVRGLAATARGPVVIGHGGRLALDGFVTAPLPTVNGIVIVDEQLGLPDLQIVARAQAALTLVGPACGRLERLTIGAGDATDGEARVGTEVDAGDLVASAQAAFVRAAAALKPVFGNGGVLVEKGRRLPPAQVLARAAGNAVALPWRADRAAAASAVIEDLDDLAVLAEPTPTGTELVDSIRNLAAGVSRNPSRALLVNPDASDFVYSFQFGRSVERRCVERGLRVDRIVINTGKHLNLAAELGKPVPAPVADGIEFLLDSEQDASLATVLRRLAARRYTVSVTNVRPALFYDLLATGLLATPTLLWDRHLHGGLREEGERRGVAPSRLRGNWIRAWSLDRITGSGIQRSLAAAGLDNGSGRIWPLDLDFFQSTLGHAPGRLFAGGENGRDWPLFVEAIRDLPFKVHLVTGQAPAPLPPHVHTDARLPLCRFRDAMAAAEVTAVPLIADAAAGVSVIPMAMALGVAVVATRTPWTEPLVTDGEDALLVPAGDVRAFRDALLRLHEQPDLRTRLVKNARRRVAALCDLEEFTREMFATLDVNPGTNAE